MHLWNFQSMIRRGANYVENRAYYARSPDPHSLLHSMYLLSAVIRHLFFMAVHPYLGALRNLTKSKMGGVSFRRVVLQPACMNRTAWNRSRGSRLSERTPLSILLAGRPLGAATEGDCRTK